MVRRVLPPSVKVSPKTAIDKSVQKRRVSCRKHIQIQPATRATRWTLDKTFGCPTVCPSLRKFKHASSHAYSENDAKWSLFFFCSSALDSDLFGIDLDYVEVDPAKRQGAYARDTFGQTEGMRLLTWSRLSKIAFGQLGNSKPYSLSALHESCST